MIWIWVWLIGTGVTAVGLRILQVAKPEAFYTIDIDPKEAPDVPFSPIHFVASALWFFFIPAVTLLLVLRLAAKSE